jgi:hypothetical protein
MGNGLTIYGRQRAISCRRSVPGMTAQPIAVTVRWRSDADVIFLARACKLCISH